MMDIQEILKKLPHRYPFLLVDRVVSIIPSKSIVTLKNVTVNEPFFLGHFPEYPIMPGVLILESMAQTTGLIALHANAHRANHNFLFLFAAADKVRFKRSVVPGDQLIIEAEVLWVKRDIWKCLAKATVAGELVCSAELTGAGRQMNND